ncbi:hypothetical protein CBL_05616 [Carabus blaptoides fortunei]
MCEYSKNYTWNEVQCNVLNTKVSEKSATLRLEHSHYFCPILNNGQFIIKYSVS